MTNHKIDHTKTRKHIWNDIFRVIKSKLKMENGSWNSVWNFFILFFFIFENKDTGKMEFKKCVSESLY